MKFDVKDTQTAVKYFFVALAISELLSHLFGWVEVHHFTKPLLMPVLLVYLRKAMKAPLNTSFMLAVGALLFSFGGDAMLMFDSKPIYFLIGLGSFAIAQTLYVFAFRKARYDSDWRLPTAYQLGYAAPFVIFVIILLWMLLPVVGEDMRIPVVVYALLILSMAVSAVYRVNRTNQDSYNQVFMGAVLFVLSDTLLAINKFHTPMEYSRIWVMSTYILAQWNIINGLVKHYNERPSI